MKTLNIGQLSWIGGVDTDLKDAALKRTGTSSGKILSQSNEIFSEKSKTIVLIELS